MADIDRQAKLWPVFAIEIEGHAGAVLYTAPTRSRARYLAFQDYREHARRITFGEFQRCARVKTLPREKWPDGYDYVRRNYDVHPEIGARYRLVNEGASSGQEGVCIWPGRSTAYVVLAMDGRDFPARVHPYSVERIEP